MIAAAYKSDKKNPFVSLSDHEMLEKYRVKSFEVQGNNSTSTLSALRFAVLYGRAVVAIFWNLGIAGALLDQIQRLIYKSDEMSFVGHGWRNYLTPTFLFIVGLHELLGHGSGKLLRKEADGSLNFPSDVVNPLDGLPVSKMYEPGESYDSKFTRLGSAYEECRAECVGLYLSTDKDVLKIFGISDSEEMFNHTYTNW